MTYDEDGWKDLRPLRPVYKDRIRGEDVARQICDRCQLQQTELLYVRGPRRSELECG